METRQNKEITPAALRKTLSLEALFENIRLNQAIPTFLGRIRENNADVQQLLTAIQTGDSEAAVFDRPHCYIFLLHLLETKAISDAEFFTVYFYLMALMQYTDRQPMKPDDQDIKVTREFAVDKLVENGKLTKEAKVYLAIATQRFADLGYSIDQLAVRKFILSLPPTEQWLLKIKSIKDLRKNWYLRHGRTEYLSSESLQAIVCNNIPFLVLTTGAYIADPKGVRKKNASFWVPSASVIQYMLCIMSPHPVCMKPVFGITGLEKLHRMHANHEHPIQLYAYDVKSNMYEVDRYRAGPLVSALHDITHVFSGTWLRPIERDAIFSCLIPFVEKARDATQDKAFFETLVRKLGDLDLTEAKKFLNAETRFEKYVKRCVDRSGDEHVLDDTDPEEQLALMARLYVNGKFSAAQREHLQHLIPLVALNKALAEQQATRVRPQAAFFAPPPAVKRSRESEDPTPQKRRRFE